MKHSRAGYLTETLPDGTVYLEGYRPMTRDEAEAIFRYAEAHATRGLGPLMFWSADPNANVPSNENVV